MGWTGQVKLVVKFKASKHQRLFVTWTAALWCVAVKQSCKSTQKQPRGVNVVSYTSKLKLRQGNQKHDQQCHDTTGTVVPQAGRYKGSSLGIA